MQASVGSPTIIATPLVIRMVPKGPRAANGPNAGHSHGVGVPPGFRHDP